jgi:hypothetical protein
LYTPQKFWKMNRFQPTLFKKMTMTPTLLLAELAFRLNAPTLTFNQQGCARLACGPDMHHLQIQFEREESPATALHVWCDLGPAPLNAAPQSWKNLLQANLLGSQTGGAVLALDAAQERIVLCRSFAGDDTDAAVFIAGLEAFIEAAARWHLQLQKPDAAVGNAAAAAFPADVLLAHATRAHGTFA